MSGEAPKFYEGEGNLGAPGRFYQDPIDFGLEAASRELRDSYDQAVIDGDRQGAEAIRHQQGMNSRMSQAMVEMQGLDPAMRTPIDAYPNDNIEFDRMMKIQSMQEREFEGVLAQNGWAESEAFLEQAKEAYRQQNKVLENVDTAGMGPYELFDLQRSLRPVVMDPNLVANERGKLAKIDAELKRRFGQQASVFTHPRTAKVANWIQREWGTGAGGFIASDQQEMTLGALGEAADVLHTAGESFGDPFFAFLWGGMRMLGLPTPTNYTEGPNGEILTNEAKVFGLSEVGISLYAALMGQDVQRSLAGYGSAKQEQAFQLDEWQNVTRGFAAGVGGLAGYTQVGGRLMVEGQKAFTAYGKKGLEWLARKTPHGAKIGNILTTVGGAAVGEGFHQAVSQGDAKGYLKAFTAGAVMGPVLVGLGVMGKQTERLLNKRTKFPRRVDAAIAGAVEAHGFLGWNQVQSTMLWEFMQHPSESTWQEYVSTVLSFAFVKGAGGRTPGGAAAQQMMEFQTGVRRASRMRIAEDISALEREKAKLQAKKPREPGEVPGMTEAIKALPRTNKAERVEAEGIEAVFELARELEYLEKKPYVQELEGYFRGYLEGGADPATALRGAARMLSMAHPVSKDDPNFGTFQHAVAMKRAGTIARMRREREKAESVPRETLEHQAAAAGDVVGKPKSVEEQRRELEELMRQDEAEERRAGLVEQVKAKEAREKQRLPDPAELRRLRAEGYTSENLARLNELQRRAHGAYTEGLGALGERMGRMVKGEPGERAPVTEGRQPRPGIGPREIPPEEIGPTYAARPTPGEKMRKALGEAKEIWRRRIEGETQRRRGELVEKIQRTEIEEREAQLRKLADRVGVPYESFKELGDALYEGDYRRVRQIERDLDVAEGLSDPILNQELRDAMEADALKAAAERKIEEPGELGISYEERYGEEFIGPKPPLGPLERSVAPDEVRPEFGERFGPESMRSVANPYRQQKRLTEDEVMLSEIASVLQGRRPRKGFRIPFTAKRVRPRAGSPVQLVNREGYISDRNTLGVFKVFENITRTKEGLDLVVMLHEWSHGLQRQVQIGASGTEFWRGVRKWMKTLDADVIDDMRSILEFYPGIDKKPKMVMGAEAWAEWFARDLLGDPTLYESYPALSRHMLEWLNAPEQRVLRDGQYRDAKAMVRTWRDMGSTARANASVRRRPPKDYDPKSFGESAARFLDAMVDDQTHLKRSYRRAFEHSGRDPSDTSIMDDPTRLVDAVAMTAANAAHAWLERGPTDIARRRLHGVRSWFDIVDEVGKGYKGADKARRTREFYNYIYYIRAIGRIDRGDTMTLPKSDYVVAAHETLARNPDFARITQDVKAFTDSLVDLLGQAGGLTDEEVQWIKDKDVLYIPMFRILESEGWSSGIPGLGARARSLKRTKGGSRAEIMDPAEAMMEMVRQVIVKANTQTVLKALWKNAITEGMGEFATIVPRDNVPEGYRVDQILRQMQKKVATIISERGEETDMIEKAFGEFGQILKDENVSDAIVTLFAQASIPMGQHAGIMVYTPKLTEAEIEQLPRGWSQKEARKHNGKMVWLQVDPQAYQGLMALDRPITSWSPDNWLMRVVARPTASMLKFFATGANPAFAVANQIRDTSSAAVFSPEGKFDPLNGLRTTIYGAAAQIMYGTQPWFQKVMKRIAGEDPFKREIVDTIYATGARAVSIHDEGMRRQMRGEAPSVVNLTRKALDAWSNFWSAAEGWVRLGEALNIAKKEMVKRGQPLTAKAWRELPIPEALEITMLMTEGYKERSINFARAGSVARSWNMMSPYFTASIAAMRKTIRALSGMEGRTDEERARFQRAAFANGIASITLPTLTAWWLVKDEDWYQDLPDWRKNNFLNFKLPGTDQIMSLPLPFELGFIFGTVPMNFADRMTDGNPSELLPTMWQAMFPYMENMSGLIPVFARGPLEVTAGFDLFRRQPLTPYWIEQSKAPREQMRESTSYAAQWLFDHGFNLVTDNPIETEHLLGSYTAGASTTLLRSIDEISSLKDHPGISNYAPGLSSFFNRFLRQRPHGPSRTVDQLYDEGRRLEQLGREAMTPAESAMLTRINDAKQELARLRKAVDLGRMDRVEADRRSFEIANRIMGSVK